MYRIDFTESAMSEVLRAQEWLEQRATGLGERFFEQILKLLPILERNPEQFSLVEEFPDGSVYRMALVKYFRYRVVFEVMDHDNIVRILRITHPSRDNWLP